MTHFEAAVFPTPVGVFPSQRARRAQFKSLPHARGGVSKPCGSSKQRCCLPHARGGVSISGENSFAAGGSSPRPWGCFFTLDPRSPRSSVFPTPVGVFLAIPQPQRRRRRLPHARGGVSRSGLALMYADRSSPRPWGCFSGESLYYGPTGVFPTPVGVFPCIEPLAIRWPSLPHARGGVSEIQPVFDKHKRSSPRPWGCFSIIQFADPKL